ncbi:hypothetical protein RvY_00552-2 [Ramazzottius varieornatus]|uniref:Uncharacterized protein n=1 Tax=Ramazzottius varieornatus TaxID=947166 RepID=A0A1D1UKF3_RAMVA|nr:hypothetical protein RvY_00552-2 [Ramazzottius varieornatus]
MVENPTHGYRHIHGHGHGRGGELAEVPSTGSVMSGVSDAPTATTVDESGSAESLVKSDHEDQQNDELSDDVNMKALAELIDSSTRNCSYSQNFHGVVCTCKKSLAGTTASTGNLTEVASGTAANAGADEDIVQCRICEEQYHASHIGVTEEDFGEEWAGEMVCRNCLNEHDFLRYYQADLNNPEAFIPEAGQICTLAALKRKFGEQQSAGRSYVFSGSWWGNLCRCSDCQVGHFVGCLSLCTQMSDLFVLFSAGHVQETECGLPSRSRGYFRLVRGTRGYKGDGKCPACSCNVSRRNLCADLRRF